MSKLIKIALSISNWQERVSPAYDKLKHFYWGDILYSNIGTLLGLILAVVYPIFIWSVLPLICCFIPGKSKEYIDGLGHGNKDSEDVKFTLYPSIRPSVLLFIIIYLLRELP